MKNLFFLLLALTFSFSASANDNPELAKISENEALSATNKSNILGMVTGSQTGTYFRFGHDIKKIAKKSGITIDVKESTGSIDNIDRVGSTENAAFGIVQSDVLGFLARSGETKSQKIVQNLRMVFPFYQEEVHIIANKEIENFEDLKGKNIVVGQKGSGSWLTSMNLFNITGVKPQKMLRLSPEEGLVAVLNNKADAMIFVAGKPVKLFKNLENLAEHKNYSELLKNIHFIPIKNKKVLKEYSPSKITKTDYDIIEDDIETVAVTAVLMSYDFSDEGSSYAKTRCDNIKNFTEAVAKNLSDLKKNGHPKWTEVDLDAGVGIWRKDKCSISNSPSAALEDELLNTLNLNW